MKISTNNSPLPHNKKLQVKLAVLNHKIKPYLFKSNASFVFKASFTSSSIFKNFS